MQSKNNRNNFSKKLKIFFSMLFKKIYNFYKCSNNAIKLYTSIYVVNIQLIEMKYLNGRMN